MLAPQHLTPPADVRTQVWPTPYQLLHCGCGRRMRGEARVQRHAERRYYRCPGPCEARLKHADTVEQTVLDAIAAGVLPIAAIDAARDELRRRLGAPREATTETKRQQLTERLERLRRQHEWGD